MQLALAHAHLAAAQGEVPVGAVVVKDGQLLATGRNTPVADRDPTAHAEVVALRAAAKALGNYRLNGCTLYVTLEPCAMCSGALLHARVDRVVFGAPDPKTGAAGSVVNLFAQPQLNPHTQLHGGVLAEPCGQALRTFFAPRRRNLHPLREDALRTPPDRWQHLPDWPWPTQTTTDLPTLNGLRLAWFDTALPLTERAPTAQPTPSAQQNLRTPPAHSPEVQVCVCLHPDGAWSYAYRHLAAALVAHGWRVLMPDLIGFGHSDKPKKAHWHTPQRHAQVLHEWALGQGVDHAVWVVPHAGGVAEVAKELLGQHPHLARAVVPLATDSGAATVKKQPTATAPLYQPDLAAYQAPFPNAGFKAAVRACADWSTLGRFHSGGGTQIEGCANPQTMTHASAANPTFMPPHGLDDATHCATLASALMALSEAHAAGPDSHAAAASTPTGPTTATPRPGPVVQLANVKVNANAYSAPPPHSDTLS